ncbi:MAG: hypothetical protein PWP50_1123 [Synergistaceae bacterium]|nr:hypothetical protein [Synergistaceae bacterium]
MPIRSILHISFIDMIRMQIACDACEEVNVRFAYSFRKFRFLTE